MTEQKLREKIATRYSWHHFGTGTLSNLKDEDKLEAYRFADEILTDIAEACKAGMKEVVEASGELLEIGRKAIEDTLVEWRDNRLSEFTRGNGLVIKEKDGTDSSIIRFGPETALRIGLRAMEQAKLNILLPVK